MSKSPLLVFLRCATVVASIAILAAPAQAQQKSAKACEAEWTANKASIQGSGKTKKAFMIECRAGTGPVAKAPSEAATAGQEAATKETAPARQRTAKRGQTSPTISTGAAEYASEAEAKTHCPGDTVVWANTRSKVYHFAGSRSYGHTKRGAYMCEKDTASAGLRSAKNEKRPQ
jgi:hypothetical protein